jgi:hypothetical protein
MKTLTEIFWRYKVLHSIFDKQLKTYTMNKETIKVVVCYCNSLPKGFMTLRNFLNFTNRSWWDSTKTIEIPKEYWENVHIGNIDRYVEMYENNPKWWNVV